MPLKKKLILFIHINIKYINELITLFLSSIYNYQLIQYLLFDLMNFLILFVVMIWMEGVVEGKESWVKIQKAIERWASKGGRHGRNRGRRDMDLTCVILWRNCYTVLPNHDITILLSHDVTNVFVFVSFSFTMFF